MENEDCTLFQSYSIQAKEGHASVLAKRFTKLEAKVMLDAVGTQCSFGRRCFVL
jgi:hypothetical protein